MCLSWIFFQKKKNNPKYSFSLHQTENRVTLSNMGQTTQIHIFITVTLEFNFMTPIYSEKKGGGRGKQLQSRACKVILSIHYWKT